MRGQFACNQRFANNVTRIAWSLECVVFTSGLRNLHKNNVFIQYLIHWKYIKRKHMHT